MRESETRGGLLDEYDRLVTESQARRVRSRELEGAICRLQSHAADLTLRMRALDHWLKQSLAGHDAGATRVIAGESRRLQALH